jgi:hypothetical protein
MKTLYDIRQFAVIIVLGMITATAAGQSNARENRRDNQKEVTTVQRTSRSNTASAREQRTTAAPTQRNDRAVENNRNQASNNNNRTVHTNTNQTNRNTVHDNRNRVNNDHNRNGRNNNEVVKPGNNSGKGNNHGKGNSSSHVKHNHHHNVYHHAPIVHHKPPKRNVYYRHLPTQRVNRFYYHGHDYIYSNNYFYRYHPRRGYILADIPFMRVHHLPPRYMVRVYNGHPYIYSNGFMYLPYEAGYVMVPAPARPHASLNIVLNW